jgi:hypothetical protein
MVRNRDGVPINTSQLPLEPGVNAIWPIDSGTFGVLTPTREYIRVGPDGHRQVAALPRSDRTVSAQALFDSLVVLARADNATNDFYLELRNREFELLARKRTGHSLTKDDVFIMQSPFDSTIGVFWGSPGGIIGARYSTGLRELPWTRNRSTATAMFSRTGLPAFWPSVAYAGDSLAVVFQREENGAQRVWMATTGIDRISNERAGQLHGSHITIESVAPNPVRETASLTIGSPELVSASVAIYSLDGEEISRVNRAILPGLTDIELPMDLLPAGHYYVRVSAKGESDVAAIVYLGGE